MARVGFLGCGKIGKAMIGHLKAQNDHSVAFVQNRSSKNDSDLGYPVVNELDRNICKADLLVECATADALQQYFDYYIQQGDVLIFSLTAFSNKEFADKAFALSKRFGTRIYFPHGAIMGLDGIYDARDILTSVMIETIKNPNSLGREDTERTVIFEGPTREICALYPRNVNVHAAIALAGIGFDKTVSKVISDPGVDTNSHIIRLEGKGIRTRLDISSFSTGGVTGQYTPISACGSLDRVLGGGTDYQFV